MAAAGALSDCASESYKHGDASCLWACTAHTLQQQNAASPNADEHEPAAQTLTWHSAARRGRKGYMRPHMRVTA